MPENLPSQESPEQIKTKRIKNFEALLGIFGNEKARDSFIDLCKKYWEARLISGISLGDSENYRPVRKVEYSPPGRADIHNEIMEIISRLATQAKNLNPEQTEALRVFVNREEVAQSIREYIADEKEKDNEYYADEDQPDSKIDPRRNSDTAYYHNLGHGN